MYLCRRPVVKVGAVLVLLAFGVAAAFWWWSPQWSEEEVRRAVVSTVQREAPASFYVTGTLDVIATSTVSNTEVLLPDLLGWEVGTVTSTVRVPGRIYYGFDVQQLEAADIQVHTDGRVTVALPELRIYAVEPVLEEMEVQTEAGWRRYYDLTVDERVERAALRRVRSVLHRQGEAHLKTSVQPRIHTARALKKLLAPVLQAAGYADPRIRVEIGNRLVMGPQG